MVRTKHVLAENRTRAVRVTGVMQKAIRTANDVAIRNLYRTVKLSKDTINRKLWDLRNVPVS